MTKAWRILGAIALTSALAMGGGCVVGSGDDTGGSGGLGGGGGSTGGKGGSSATGGSSGGSSGSGGSAGATGGASGSGGSAGYVCANVSPGGGTKGSCVPDDPNDSCQVCVQTSCCAQFEACLTQNPNNPCAFGAPDGSGEIYCMMSCVQSGQGTATECGGTCTSPGCGTIDPATSELWGCLDQNCAVQCAL